MLWLALRLVVQAAIRLHPTIAKIAVTTTNPDADVSPNGRQITARPTIPVAIHAAPYHLTAGGTSRLRRLRIQRGRPVAMRLDPRPTKPNPMRNAATTT